jgi:pimeloyl-ACP methyl ester carboxylesterase
MFSWGLRRVVGRWVFASARMRQPRRLVVIVAVLAGLAVAPAGASAAGVAWSKCYGGPFQCAIVHVPLDYDQPNGATISIALTRLPAADPAHRIGSLFINPGGPGGSGVDFVHFAGPSLFTQAVRDRFDLVGFDPRGVQRSTGLRCFGTPRQWGPLFNDFAWPTDGDQLLAWEGADRYLADACAQRAGAIAAHMSTANVARDLDRLRAAVGDSKLSYYGVSYGTYLGVTYANLFPRRVGALVVDGNLDPIAWSTGSGDGTSVPFSTRLRSDLGAQATLEEFFRLCDAGTCAFGPDSADRYAAVVDKLKTRPLVMTLPDGSTQVLDWTNLIGMTLGAMYDSLGWEDFAQFLADVESQASAQALGSEYARLRFRPSYMLKRGDHGYPNFVEPFPAVACGDSINPTSYDAWVTAAASSSGYFGPLWTWASSICAVWPFADGDRYLGPFDHQTADPVLVVGNLFDPATRYAGSLKVASLLPGSRLLTLHGWGHTSLFLSSCVDGYIAGYLIDHQLPPAGTVCEQDHVPFT